MMKYLLITLGIIGLLFWLAPEEPKQLTQTRTAEVVFGATGGPTGAGTAAADTTTCSDNMSWGGITGTELQSNDTTYVSYTGKSWDSGDISDGLEASNFGFSTSGTIDGIQVELINWSPESAQYEDVILITAAGTRVGDDKEDSTVTIPTSDPSSTYKSWGGTSDTWNAGLTSAQVNDAGFGVQFCWQATTNDSTIFVDHVRVTVTFTPPTAAEEIFQSEYWYD